VIFGTSRRLVLLGVRQGALALGLLPCGWCRAWGERDIWPSSFLRLVSCWASLEAAGPWNAIQYNILSLDLVVRAPWIFFPATNAVVDYNLVVVHRQDDIINNSGRPFVQVRHAQGDGRIGPDIVESAIQDGLLQFRFFEWGDFRRNHVYLLWLVQVGVEMASFPLCL
jgi:hypothetical protein